jgi:hypothetical protein
MTSQRGLCSARVRERYDPVCAYVCVGVGVGVGVLVCAPPV